jgi:hypothetical protein
VSLGGLLPEGSANVWLIVSHVAEDDGMPGKFIVVFDELWRGLV